MVLVLDKLELPICASLPHLTLGLLRSKGILRMQELSDSTWIYLFEELLKSKVLLTSSDHLGDFVEDFEEMLDELRVAVSNASDDAKLLERYKHNARLADDQHDDAHRALLKLLEAFTFRGDEQARATVLSALDNLYPERLAMISASFADEINATEQFLVRLQHEEVARGLALIRASIPDVDRWSQHCVQSGRALGEAVSAFAEQEQRAAETTPDDTPELIAVRKQVHRLWRLFMQTVNFTYPEGQTDSEELREALLGRYVREITA